MQNVNGGGGVVVKYIINLISSKGYSVHKN